MYPKFLTMILGFWIKKAKSLSLGTILFLGVLSLGAGWSISYLETRYTMKQFQAEHHPLYRGDDEIKHDFSIKEWQPILVVLTARAGWLDHEMMPRLKSATEMVSKIPDIHRVISLANMEGAGDTKGALEIGKLTELYPESQWKKRFMEDPLISPSLISADMKSTTLAIEIPDLDGQRLATLLTTLRAQLQSQLPGVRVDVGGLPAIQSDMNILLKKELARFLFWAGLACICAVLLFFRGIGAPIACVSIVILANLWSLSYLSLSGMPFTLLSTTLPVLISVAALGMSMHTLLVYADDPERHGLGKAEWIFRVIRRLFLPNLLMALTTSVGFATLAGSDVPIIRQYGWSVCWAQLAAWLVSTLALPPLMYLLPMPQVRSWVSSRSLWVPKMLRQRKWVLAGALVLLLVAAAAGGRLNWAARFFTDLPEGEQARTSTELIDHSMGGVIPLEIELKSDVPDAWHDPVLVGEVRDFMTTWRKHPDIASGMGLPDFLDFSGKPVTDRRGIAEAIFLYSLSEDNPTATFVNADGTATRIQLRMRDLAADEMEKVSKGIEDDLHRRFPKMKILVGGMAALAHPLNEYLSWQLIGGLWESLVLITILLAFVFRSLRWSLVAAVPNLLAPIALLVVMSYLKTPIRPGIALIFSIALGVAYNNTVYLLGRLKQLQEHPSKLPVVRAWYQEGNPCLVSTLALSTGFAVFLTSQFELNRAFGAYMLLSLVSGLFGDLVLLPALLRAFPRLLAAAPSVMLETVAPGLEKLEKITASGVEAIEKITVNTVSTTVHTVAEVGSGLTRSKRLKCGFRKKSRSSRSKKSV